MYQHVNFQPIEKSVHGKVALDVHSIFYTIQGEGPHTGKPAVFIRLAGCNLQCPSCDTDYTTARHDMFAPQILQRVIELSPNNRFRPLVVITGGEPFRQHLDHLCMMLHTYGYKVQIETNGSLGPRVLGSAVWQHVDVVCSPKTGKINKWIADHAICFKYVLNHTEVDPQDGLPIYALNHTASPRVFRTTRDVPIYLQPMDAKDAEHNRLNIEAVKRSCMLFGYNFQLQTHKYIGVE